MPIAERNSFTVTDVGAFYDRTLTYHWPIRDIEREWMERESGGPTSV